MEMLLTVTDSYRARQHENEQPHVWYANFFLPPRNMQSGSAGCKRETGCMKKRFPVYVFDVTYTSVNIGDILYFKGGSCSYTAFLVIK